MALTEVGLCGSSVPHDLLKRMQSACDSVALTRATPPQLRLDNNDLRRVPVRLYRLTNLTALELLGNPVPPAGAIAAMRTRLARRHGGCRIA